MNKAKMFLCACLCVVAVLPTPAKSDSVEVHHGGKVAWLKLSDLIVYGDPNDPNEKKVILAPNDPNDDIYFVPCMTRVFSADFKITSYVVSHSFKDEKGNYQELESWHFDVTRIVPKKLGMIRDPDEQQTVVLAVDQAVAPEPPPEGTILAVTEGQTPIFGWFVGTGIDFETGQVTGAYTGNVEMFSTAFEVLVFTPPYPPDGAVDIPLYADLHWTKSEEADSYDVYFGTNFDDVKYGRRGTFKGSQSGTTYDPGTLEPCTMYYWRIEPAIEEEEEEEEPPIIVDSAITTGDVRIYADIMYIGDVWSFTTGPAKATNPYPVDGATDVDPNAILSWTPGCLAAFHDVYFGTDFYAVANADTSDTTGIYRARLDTNSYDPGGLEPGTVYYWKIDEVVPTVEGVDIVCKGDVWSFTTMSGPVEATNPYPPDGAVDIPLDAKLFWPVSEEADWYDVYFGTDRDAVANANPGSPEYKCRQAFDATGSTVE